MNCPVCKSSEVRWKDLLYLIPVEDENKRDDYYYKYVCGNCGNLYSGYEPEEEKK